MGAMCAGRSCINGSDVWGRSCINGSDGVGVEVV